MVHPQAHQRRPSVGRSCWCRRRRGPSRRRARALACQSGLGRVAVKESRMDLNCRGDGVSAGVVSGRFVGFTALTVVAAVGSLAALAWKVGWHLGAPARFWLLALFVLAGEFLPIPVPRRHGLDRVAVSTAFAFAVLLCAGVLAACVVYAAASAIADLSARTTPIKVVFNSAQYVLSLAGAGVVLIVAGASSPVALHTGVVAAILLAALACFVIGHVLAGTGAALLAGVPVDW